MTVPAPLPTTPLLSGMTFLLRPEVRSMEHMGTRGTWCCMKSGYRRWRWTMRLRRSSRPPYPPPCALLTPALCPCAFLQKFPPAGMV